MDLQAVRQGLADAAATADPGLNCTGYVPDSINEPAFFPAEVDIDYDQTFGGSDTMTITCRLLVSRSDDEAGQKNLNAYLSRGTKSVKAAIEGTPGVAQTLSGACDDVHVMRVQGYRFYQHNGSAYIGAELVVKVIGDPEE
ncbi:hypothetical protein ACFP2T_13495 [Plantactinospora solaniradicis]|uniref:Uncharacterized protein n=1 Tax=Plantactinospora solaniradicis TaxID=1723736 RepID=A0ABW1K7S7_9ACTN